MKLTLIASWCQSHKSMIYLQQPTFFVWRPSLQYEKHTYVLIFGVGEERLWSRWSGWARPTWHPVTARLTFRAYQAFRPGRARFAGLAPRSRTTRRTLHTLRTDWTLNIIGLYFLLNFCLHIRTYPYNLILETSMYIKIPWNEYPV